ncbi:hypothetical protein [Marinibacterium profundimaris]|uniref:Uncharacterized protein n=1 Tax=Marinibacterium profundimaris TaxID=1679460 RepID=A0A225NBC7_9RHOB|nr:hypothetical protein [Marinibacterium profundimaris]OWU67793.1 hypothetical protein ATO3_25525 [Marinibacterium profundimaris]
MTKDPACGNSPALPSIKDCQHAAVTLAGTLDAIELMLMEEGAGHSQWSNPALSVVHMARQHAQELADNLDRVSS